ncbi:MAG: VOC family protein [Acidobacteriota bacterium]
MQLYPNLTFDGQCEAAFQFYERCLGGKVTFLMTYENTAAELHAPPGWGMKVSHATFALDRFLLSGSDALPGSYRKPQGFTLQLNLSDPEEAERIFHALAENGAIEVPLQETFWARRFGVLVDAFGIPWLINCEQPAGANH